MPKFVDEYLAGRITEDVIDDYIGWWHEGSSKQSLIDFLGFTKEEYFQWVKDAKPLDEILQHRKSIYW